MTGPTPGGGGPPAWLPAHDPFDGDWFAYVERLYLRYLADLVDSRPIWRGKQVFVDDERLVNDKHFTFWHITSGIDAKTKDLLDPDLERCARICWVRPILEAPEAEVRTWIQANRNGVVAVALPDFSFLVIIKEVKARAFLKSAYVVDRQTRRDQYGRECDASEKR